MAFPQMKKRFSLFSSPPLAPQILSNASSLLTTPQEIREDNKPTSDEIRKSFENLEKLVLTADEYRDCVNKLSKISKNFSKCLKDYGNCKGIDKSYVQCLQFIAQFYENHAEVQAKLYKALQKEFEILQRFWDKYSKKVAKDGKAHYEHVGDLDKQIKKINKDYEKKSKKESKASHEKYVASLTSISTDVARLRAEYAEEEMRREKHTHSVISQIICRFTEGQFASFNDSLKKCEPSITKVKEWTPFAGQDIPLPLDLDASISEMQKVAMRHKTAPSPTETPSIESNPAPIINDINEYENETITPAPPIVTAVAKSSNSVPNSKKKLSNDSHLTPNLLSSLSIGIHDNDNPFFRDGSNMIIKTGEKDSTKLEENHASSLSITKSNDKIVSLKKDQLKNEKNINGSDIDNENEFNKPNDKYYSNEYHVMDIERIANDSPAPSFETERLVRSFPIDLPVRSQPSTPTNSPSEKSSVFYNMKTDHLSGYIRDLDSIINSNTDHQGTHPYHDEIHVTSPTTHLAKSYIDRTPQRQYNIQPRRAFTEYSSSDNDNKCGSSVADIRERLLSLNDNERKSTTSSTRDFPKPRQGYVNEVKTKFVGMGESNNNDTPPYSLITSNNYGDDDDMYPDQVEHFEDTNPASLSKPIINEQCDCHNCRELRKATIANDLTYHPQESFLHEDD